MFGIKKCSSLVVNDCQLLKVKKRDSVIETSLNDGAHTVFIKTNIDAKKHVQS